MIAWNKSLFYSHVNGDCVAAYSEVSQYVVEKYFSFNAKCVTSKEFAEEFAETDAMHYCLLYNKWPFLTNCRLSSPGNWEVVK